MESGKECHSQKQKTRKKKGMKAQILELNLKKTSKLTT